MKKYLIIMAVALLPLIAGAGLEFETTEIVKNPELMDQKAEAVFRFTNTSEETVGVMDPQSPCGCTVPNLGKNGYEPGESGEIRAIFTFGSRVGIQTKRITLRTTEPTVETYTLTMTTHIPEWVKIEPRVLRWTIDESVSTQEIRVTIPEGRDVDVEMPEQEPRYFDSELNEDGDGVYVLKITPKSLAEKATEFLRLTAKISDGSTTQSRSFGVHCLVR